MSYLMEHWLDEWIRVIKVERKKKERECIHKTIKFGICIYVKYELKKIVCTADGLR